MKTEFSEKLMKEFGTHQRKLAGSTCPYPPSNLEVLIDKPNLYLVSIKSVIPCSLNNLPSWMQRALLIEDNQVKELNGADLLAAPLSAGDAVPLTFDDLPNYEKRLRANVPTSRCLDWVIPQIKGATPTFYFSKDMVTAYSEKALFHPCWAPVSYSYEELSKYMRPAYSVAKKLN